MNVENTLPKSRTRQLHKLHNTIRCLITFLSNMSPGPLSNGTLHLYF